MAELTINKENIKNIFEFTDEIVKNYPGRMIGTENCKKAACKIKDELAGTLGAGYVKMEPFDAHPTSFIRGLQFLGPALMYITLVISFFVGWIHVGSLDLALMLNMGIAIFILLVTLSQFFFYKHTFDKLFPKKTGYNVFGILEPKSPATQQIILEGHHDAQYVMLLDRAPKLYFLVMMMAVLSVFIELIVTTTWFILDAFAVTGAGWLVYLLLITAVMVTPLLAIMENKVSPAAGDNMMASSLIIELAKMVVEHEKTTKQKLLNNTRIIFLSADGEECGLRGATAYCKQHYKELHDIKTYALTIDPLYKKDQVRFTEKEINGFVFVSRKLAEFCVGVAKELDIHAEIGAMTFGLGATDAGAFARDGRVEATNLMGIYTENLFMVPYHTSRDTTDAVDEGIVEQALRICARFIVKMDKEAKM